MLENHRSFDLEPPSTVDAEEDVVNAFVPELNEDVVGDLVVLERHHESFDLEPPSTVDVEEDVAGVVVLDGNPFV